VETFPDKHEDIHDYRETLKYAWMYAKTVTLGEEEEEEGEEEDEGMVVGVVVVVR